MCNALSFAIVFIVLYFTSPGPHPSFIADPALLLHFVINNH